MLLVVKNLRHLAETDRFPQLARSIQGDGAHSNSMGRRAESNKQLELRCRRNVSNRCIQQDTAPLVTAHTAGDTSQSTLLKNLSVASAFSSSALCFLLCTGEAPSLGGTLRKINPNNNYTTQRLPGTREVLASR